MKDFLLNVAMDIGIVNGDLGIGNSDGQQEQTLMVAQKGSFKQYPDIGIGIENFINGDAEAMVSAIRAGFAADGISLDSISYDEITGGLAYERKGNS